MDRPNLQQVSCVCQIISFNCVNGSGVDKTVSTFVDKIVLAVGQDMSIDGDDDDDDDSDIDDDDER